MRILATLIIIALWIQPTFSQGMYDDDEYIKYQLKHNNLDDYFKIPNPKEAADLLHEYSSRVNHDTSYIFYSNYYQGSGRIFFDRKPVKLFTITKYKKEELEKAIQNGIRSEKIMGIIRFNKPLSVAETASILRLGVKLFPRHGNPRSVQVCRGDISAIIEIMEWEYVDWIGKVKSEYKYFKEGSQTQHSSYKINSFVFDHPEYEDDIIKCGGTILECHASQVKGWGLDECSYVIEIDKDNLQCIASLWWVKYIDYGPVYEDNL